ncbi:DUF6328 family protein [Streptomyces roseicoloratus]|uniref:DUF6328 family protein n=1 Tax=Streptomyces roseicoloratus TaxID=2508722 RepID=A0ABY9RQJ4_9ACTN|nr:DUF6328 family protein [Streptomyces roseicoloratus]WMX44018.1 DUF6328 family protein [Streptomyces roseicoloratus]
MTVTSSNSGNTTGVAGPPEPADERLDGVDGVDGADGFDGAGPPETARERVNRRWTEILQETRVAQTGVQILFGFLLSIAFTPRFGTLSTFDRVLYVVTVVLAASSTAALIAPVSIHRCLSGLRMKREVVEAAGRMMTCGIVLLALTIACTLLFILNAVLPTPFAQVIVGGVMVWFALCWYVLPFRLRRRAADRRGP